MIGKRASITHDQTPHKGFTRSTSCKINYLGYFIDARIPQEALDQLRKELEDVIQTLNRRIEEQQNFAKEQQARIQELEQEGEELRAELEEGKDALENLEDVEQKLQCM